jgi:cobalt-zinc-cadmium efflux system outer membrane protein
MVLWFAFWTAAHLDAAWAEDRSLKESSALEWASSESKPEPKEPTGVITLKDAIYIALLRNPELKAFSLEIRAKEARALQEGLLPNPEIEIEAENFGGSGDFSNFDSAETTIQLSQLIELGGKRSKRKKIASFERALAAWDYESKRADVLTGVAKALVEVLASQERLNLAEELTSLAERVLNTVSARVRAGKVSPIEETRARVTFSTGQIALERAKRKLEASRKQLAATWGGRTPLFEKVDGELDVITPIPSAAEIEGLISQNPDIARWVTEMEQRHASMALEDARRIPDPTISLGARNFSETDDNAFVFLVSIQRIRVLGLHPPSSL